MTFDYAVLEHMTGKRAMRRELDQLLNDFTARGGRIEKIITSYQLLAERWEAGGKRRKQTIKWKKEREAAA